MTRIDSQQRIFVDGSTTAGSKVVRVEIQALRAIAVMSVVAYHLWPERLPGGFVGVDVFFAISGYLITSHLLREVDRTGSVSLARFWSSRVRRLLPASLTVIAASTAAMYALVPVSRWEQFTQEFMASTLYVQNWLLASNAVDYSAQTNRPSPVQHFWSLSAEEQFYLIWPVLFLLAIAIAIRAQQVSHKRVIFGVLASVVVASAIYSIVLTATNPSVAYFMTPTRAWEFGLGGLLAFAASPVGRAGLRNAIAWLGFAMIVVALVTYSHDTPFPSLTALLPVVGTLAVVWAGLPQRGWSPSFLARLRPVRFLGDVSYGIYLWHWPLVVFALYVTGTQLRTLDKVVILVASVLLGWLSKILIEDPIRKRSFFVSLRPRWTFLATGIVMVAVITPSAVTYAQVTTQDAPIVGLDNPCAGAKTMLDPATCGGPQDAQPIVPFLDFAGDTTARRFLKCDANLAAGVAPGECLLNSPSRPSLSVAFVGDSHSMRLAEAMTQTAQAETWRLRYFTQQGCPLVSDRQIGAVWGTPSTATEQCARNSEELTAKLTDDHSIDVVIYTNRTRLYALTAKAGERLEAGDIENTFESLQAAGKRVLVIPDAPGTEAVPQQYSEGALDCLARQGSNRHACDLPTSATSFDDPMIEAAKATGAPVLSLNDLFCDEKYCYSFIGGLAVYTDTSHLTRSFAASLQPTLRERLVWALSR